MQRFGTKTGFRSCRTAVAGRLLLALSVQWGLEPSLSRLIDRRRWTTTTPTPVPGSEEMVDQNGAEPEGHFLGHISLYSIAFNLVVVHEADESRRPIL